MTEKFKNMFRISSSRLKGWDYGSRGLYFVTICTHDKENHFGEIVEQTRDVETCRTYVETQNFASLRQYTEIGNIAHQYWLEIPSHFPFVKLDAFVIMPNHVHGIMFIDKPEIGEKRNNIFGPQSQNLGSIIRGYKAAVKKYATIHHIEFVWQARYYEHIIRSEKDLDNIRQYINENPLKWDMDNNNPNNKVIVNCNAEPRRDTIRGM